jgi:hypothetical protein
LAGAQVAHDYKSHLRRRGTHCDLGRTYVNNPGQGLTRIMKSGDPISIKENGTVEVG